MKFVWCMCDLGGKILKWRGSGEAKASDIGKNPQNHAHERQTAANRTPNPTEKHRNEAD